VTYDESPALDAFSRVAIRLFGGGRQEDAIALTKRFAETEKDDPFLWSNLGLFYRDAGRYEESFAAYQKAVALTPNDAQLQNDTGLVLDYHLNRQNEALEYYGRAIALADHDETYGNLVRLYITRKDWDKAIEIGEKGLSIHPGNAFITRWLEVAKQGKAGTNVDDLVSAGGAGGAIRGAPSIDSVAKELGLEGERRDKVATILKTYNDSLREAYQQEQASGNWQEFRAKQAELQKSLQSSLGDVLTADELKAYLAKWPPSRASGGGSSSQRGSEGH
jgi:tetratricopeptide (TPR) repeat protein